MGDIERRDFIARCGEANRELDRLLDKLDELGAAATDPRGHRAAGRIRQGVGELRRLVEILEAERAARLTSWI